MKTRFLLICGFCLFFSFLPLQAGAAERSAGLTPVLVDNTEAPLDADSGGEDIPVDDSVYELPDYPLHARVASGEMKTYIVGPEDTLLDIARHFSMGYVEIRAANPDIDPWAPLPGSEVVIPAFRLLPRVQQKGIVVNLSEMRLYYFKTPGVDPMSFAIGIGRDGLATPTGETTIVRKTAGPSWHPTARMREEKPWLPAAIPPGPSNPLGTHALYLGWPTFLIHGSNKPWAIGRRVSSGCMRMYPEDIVRVFEMIPVGTPVAVVDQPVQVGWVDDMLYLEAMPDRQQSNSLEIDGVFVEKPMHPKTRAEIIATAGPAADKIDWRTVETVLRERRGYPVPVLAAAAAVKKTAPARKK